MLAPALNVGPLDAGIAYSIPAFAASEAPPNFHDADVGLPNVSTGAVNGFLQDFSGQGFVFNGAGLSCFTSVDRVCEFPAYTAYIRDAAHVVQATYYVPAQNFTVRKFTAPGSTITITGGSTSYANVVFSAAHGLGFGDRFWFSDSGNGDVNYSRIATVTSVVNATTITASGVPYVLGSNGTASYVGKQLGRTMGNLPITIGSPAQATATRGVAFSYPIALEAGAPSGTISAANVPEGLGLSFDGTNYLLSGTPVEYGWFPVILQAGAMQRYLSLYILPGAYDTVISSPGASNAVAGRIWTYQALAPTLNQGTLVWSTDGAPASLQFYTNITSGLFSGSFTTPGVYVFTLRAFDGLQRVSKQITVTVVPDVPLISTDYDLGNGQTSTTTFTFANNEAIRLPFSATNSPTAWSAQNLPLGLALDPDTGVLSGYVATTGLYAFTLSASNSTGPSIPQVFKLRITRAENAVNKAPYLPWLHSDSAVIDLQVPVRPPRAVSSYYMSEANTLVAALGDDVRFAVLLLDPTLSEPYLAGATGVQIGIRRADEFDDSFFWFSESAFAETTAGHAWYRFDGKLDSGTIRNWFADLNDPLAPEPASAALAAMLAVRWIGADGFERRSERVNLTIRQSSIQSTGPAPSGISGAGYPPPNLLLTVNAFGSLAWDGNYSFDDGLALDGNERGESGWDGNPT